jgi:hypothetical protein
MLEASEIDFLRKTQKARYAKRKAKRQAAE